MLPRVLADSGWQRPRQRAGWSMLLTLAGALIVLWILGLVSAHPMGGLIHILLVVAVIAILVRVSQVRRVV